jgi:heme o synthase
MKATSPTVETLGPEPAGIRGGRDTLPSRPSWPADLRLGEASLPSANQSWLAIFADLFKVRLTGLVLLTTAVGFYLGYPGAMNYLLMLHTVLGTALVASGASALNQLFEREFDARMRRTQDRPLPSGRMQPWAVLLVGIGSGVAGLVYLACVVNLAASLVGAASFLIYLFIYTPLKRVTWWNTAVGAVAGALPPLIGWTGARGGAGGAGWALFAIQAFWQVPHFMAIAWLYRADYAQAGFKMLPVVDSEGRRTARQALAYSLGLLPLSLCPFLFKLAGPVYLASALVLSLGFLGSAVQFARHRSEGRAWQLFYVSILYLPLLFGAMVLDKLR